MFHHSQLNDKQLFQMIRAGDILMAGHRKLKIYGHLKCRSGRRMKISNRVFFRAEGEALAAGFRPCGNCMRAAYKNWNHGSV